MLNKLLDKFVYTVGDDTAPIVGRIYQHEDYLGDPFKKFLCVLVLDTKDGWTKYKRLDPDTMKQYKIDERYGSFESKKMLFSMLFTN
jgi:hypothetical protein